MKWIKEVPEKDAYYWMTYQMEGDEKPTKRITVISGYLIAQGVRYKMIHFPPLDDLLYYYEGKYFHLTQLNYYLGKFKRKEFKFKLGPVYWDEPMIKSRPIAKKNIPDYCENPPGEVG